MSTRSDTVAPCSALFTGVAWWARRPLRAVPPGHAYRRAHDPAGRPHLHRLEGAVVHDHRRPAAIRRLSGVGRAGRGEGGERGGGWWAPRPLATRSTGPQRRPGSEQPTSAHPSLIPTSHTCLFIEQKRLQLYNYY